MRLKIILLNDAVDYHQLLLEINLMNTTIIFRLEGRQVVIQ